MALKTSLSRLSSLMNWFTRTLEIPSLRARSDSDLATPASICRAHSLATYMGFLWLRVGFGGLGSFGSKETVIEKVLYIIQTGEKIPLTIAGFDIA
jgi:hypothetical protein